MLSPNHLAKALIAANTVTATYRVVAIGVKGKSVVMTTNSQKTHRKGRRLRSDGAETCSSHAEMRLLAKMPEPDAVFVLRIRRDGKFAAAKPCELCQELLKNVACVVHTETDGSWSRL